MIGELGWHVLDDGLMCGDLKCATKWSGVSFVGLS